VKAVHGELSVAQEDIVVGVGLYMAVEVLPCIVVAHRYRIEVVPHHNLEAVHPYLLVEALRPEPMGALWAAAVRQVLSLLARMVSSSTIETR